MRSGAAMRDQAEIFAEWEAGQASPLVRALFAHAAEQLRPRRIEDRPAAGAEVEPFTRAELVALASQIGAGEQIDPTLAPRLARFLQDAATGGKKAAVAWVPKATTGEVQKGQSSTSARVRRINLALHHAVDPEQKMSDKGRIAHLRELWRDYSEKRWPTHAVLKSRPPSGPSNADPLLWQLAKLPTKRRILSAKTIREYLRRLFLKTK